MNKIPQRVPSDFFITRGIGESKLTHHSGSYHQSLFNAGIHEANIMIYSSMLPAHAKRIKKPRRLIRGSVLEVIQARADATEGQTCSAGIAYAWTYDKKTREKTGGLVCEISGSFTKDELKWRLRESLKEVKSNGFTHERMGRPNIIIESFVPQSTYGSAIVALCFINYKEY